MTGRTLQGLRVLVVEDEALIAMMLEDMLAGLGCVVVGPIARLAPAVSAAHQHELDCALLDVNLNGEAVLPVADALEQRRIPFLFVTGYGAVGADQRFAERPLVRKPFKRDEIAQALARLISAE
ncbi:MAG TPA: response regulator [Stellaceae bacterium]|nr:response regulator [Stellaceae bacterium]